MSNSEVRLKVLGPKVQPVEQTLNQNRLSWLRYVFGMAVEQVPRCALYSKQVMVEIWFE